MPPRSVLLILHKNSSSFHATQAPTPFFYFYILSKPWIVSVIFPYFILCPPSIFSVSNLSWIAGNIFFRSYILVIGFFCYVLFYLSLWSLLFLGVSRMVNCRLGSLLVFDMLLVFYLIWTWGVLLIYQN